MKAKHIINAALVFALPFIIILCFGALSSYLNILGQRTFIFYYKILSSLTTAISVVAYVFWLSFIIRTKEQKAKILFMCCSFIIAAFLLFTYLGYWIIPFPINASFISTTALICALSNLFAAIYMLTMRIRTRKLKS